MLHGNIDVVRTRSPLGTLQISGVGDRVVPLVRDVARAVMSSRESLVIHFRNHITHKREFTPEMADLLREAIKGTPIKVHSST
jgi:hypothetical protein